MEALHDRHEFYFMLGGGATALVALLFVATSIGIGFFTPRNQAGTRTFTSPVIVHFSGILLVSALALAPAHGHVILIALLLTGIVGIVVAGITTIYVFDFLGDHTVESIDQYA